jgi:hypothetical protein
LRQFPHVARGRLEAAFQLAHAALKLGAEAWAYRDSGQSFAGRGNACCSHVEHHQFDVVRTGFEPCKAWPVRSLCGGNLRDGVEIRLAKLGLAVQKLRPQIMKLNIEGILSIPQ